MGASRRDKVTTDLDTAAQEMADGADRLAAGDRAGAASVRSGCAGMVRWAGEAKAYFTVPDPEQEAAWERTQSIAADAGADCLAALDAGDDGALVSALDRMLDGARAGYPVLAWIQTQLPPGPP